MPKKPIALLIFCLSTSVFSNNYRILNYDEKPIHEQSELGKKRLSILSDLRNGILNAIKSKKLAPIDSLMNAGDNEFADYPWISTKEKVLILLAIDSLKPFEEDYELRKVIWYGNHSFYGRHTQAVYPSFCTHEREKNRYSNFDFAPDLAGHLSRFLSKKQLSKIDLNNDVWDFVNISKCKQKSIRPYSYKPYQLLPEEQKQLRDFAQKHPTSPFTRDMKGFIFKRNIWTGNGFIIGAGPRYDFFDSKSNQMLKDGFNGGFFIDVLLPSAKISMDLQFRHFTALRDMRLEDTTFAKGSEFNLFRFKMMLGYPVFSFYNLKVVGFGGVQTNNISTNIKDEKFHEFKERSKTALGALGGVYTDLVFPIKTSNSTVQTLVGIRSKIAYQFTNLSKVEADFGNHSITAGMSLIIGWGGFTGKTL